MERSATLLLDDCDPVLEECARLVRRLLEAEPELRIVVTTRRRLGLVTERVVAVAPLPVTLGEGIAGPAVELLAARTGPAAPELLVAVCESLEGSPLAIELAAQQLDRMSLPQLAAQVGTDGPLFYSGPAPTVRHTSLYAAHAAGYALCSPTDRRVWARLSVLPGDFDPWLAGCVCTSSDVPAAEVEASLERLRLASVLESVREAVPRHRTPEPRSRRGTDCPAAPGNSGARSCARRVRRPRRCAGSARPVPRWPRRRRSPGRGRTNSSPSASSRTNSTISTRR